MSNGHQPKGPPMGKPLEGWIPNPEGSGVVMPAARAPKAELEIPPIDSDEVAVQVLDEVLHQMKAGIPHSTFRLVLLEGLQRVVKECGLDQDSHMHASTDGARCGTCVSWDGKCTHTEVDATPESFACEHYLRSDGDSDDPGEPVVCRFCGRDADATWDAQPCETGGHVCSECLSTRTIKCVDCGKDTDPREARCYHCYQAYCESDF